MKRIFFVLSVLMFSGCITTSTVPVEGDIIRQADNVPEAFIPEEGVSLDAENCKSPMIDPRDGTELKMHRSGGGVADYEVPGGKYGIRKNELLRIHCESGEPAGVVRK